MDHKITASDSPPVEQAAAPIAGPKSYIRELTLDGKTYTLDFDFTALCEAESAFIREGRQVNLLFALNVLTLNLSRLRDLFASAVRKHHPELGYEGAVALVRTEHLYDVANVAFSVLQSEQS